MPPDATVFRKCVDCGATRNADWMHRVTGSYRQDQRNRHGPGASTWQCDPPPDPAVTGDENYRASFEAYHRTHRLRYTPDET